MPFKLMKLTCEWPVAVGVGAVGHRGVESNRSDVHPVGISRLCCVLLDDGEVSDVSQLAPEQTLRAPGWELSRPFAAVWRTINTSFCEGLHAAAEGRGQREGDARRSRSTSTP